MRQLLAIVFTVVLIVTPSCKFIKEKGLFGRKQDTIAAWQAKQESKRITDSLRVIQERLDAIETARADSLRAIEDERLAWESKHKYNIIVGSFITPEYAKTHADTYKSMGYDTRIIKLPGTNFELVSAKAFDKFSNAVVSLAQFQDTVDMNAWMYIIK
jgi:hypothetical protein